MSSSLAKTLVIPATISLVLYVFLSHLILPFFRHYHQRYAHYLPLHTISAHTSSLRDRIGDTLMRCVLRSSSSFPWRRNSVAGPGGDHHDNVSIDDEEGEIMVGMHMDPARRRELERRWDSRPESEGRLSRDLEEGFMDDSDDEEDRGRR
ncbi:uncharacterized protein ACHE_50234A [Aspergillus chevalieri]|uniref:Uncharacterized protein n=1 Tax=Aspergillus chevalieri TaxID=182096 RepID=A0A7R7VQN7_ASPCH|nr:uncharacterized protein ACHE_50234A [Aspergillus chevalieri]BCR89036.1 hypothetical protein ACHE_50234A [Aspergillus chevalieri]